MTKQLTRLCIWLCPNDPANDAFQELIPDYAAIFGTPLFEPHITLAVVPYDVTISTHYQEVAALLSEELPMQLSFSEINFSDSYVQSAYLIFNPTQGLLELREKAHKLLNIPMPSEYRPHLSIAYGTLNDRQRKLILENHVSIENPVSFNHLKLILVPTTNSSTEDIECWKSLDLI